MIQLITAVFFSTYDIYESYEKTSRLLYRWSQHHKNKQANTKSKRDQRSIKMDDGWMDDVWYAYDATTTTNFSLYVLVAITKKAQQTCNKSKTKGHRRHATQESIGIDRPTNTYDNTVNTYRYYAYVYYYNCSCCCMAIISYVREAKPEGHRIFIHSAAAVWTVCEQLWTDKVRTRNIGRSSDLTPCGPCSANPTSTSTKKMHLYIYLNDFDCWQLIRTGPDGTQWISQRQQQQQQAAEAAGSPYIVPVVRFFWK